MDQEILVSGVLTQEMILAGGSLVKSLDAAKLKAKVALWLFLPDICTYRLCLALIEVRTSGPKAIYKKIGAIEKKAPKDTPRIGIKDIAVMDDQSPLIIPFRYALRTGDGIHGIRFSRNSVNGLYIEDAYIYRVM
jgi:hypothetical protein